MFWSDALVVTRFQMDRDVLSIVSNLLDINSFLAGRLTCKQWYNIFHDQLTKEKCSHLHLKLKQLQYQPKDIWIKYSSCLGRNYRSYLGGEHVFLYIKVRPIAPGHQVICKINQN